jgi:hypothetical protein
MEAIAISAVSVRTGMHNRSRFIECAVLIHFDRFDYFEKMETTIADVV